MLQPPTSAEILHTTGSGDDRIADLKIQPNAFYSNIHQPKFYVISFPGIDISKDVDVELLERDLKTSIGSLNCIEKQSRNSLLVELASSSQHAKITSTKMLATHPVIISLDLNLSFTKGIVCSKALSYFSEHSLQQRLSSQGVTHVTQYQQPHNRAAESYVYLLTFNSSSLP